MADSNERPTPRLTHEGRRDFSVGGHVGMMTPEIFFAYPEMATEDLDRLDAGLNLVAAEVTARQLNQQFQLQSYDRDITGGGI